MDAVVGRARALLKFRGPQQLRGLAALIERIVRSPPVGSRSAPPKLSARPVIGSGKVEALCTNLPTYDLASDEEVKNVKPCELFALTALELIGVAVHSGERATFLEAVESVCRAESLLESELQDARCGHLEKLLQTQMAYQPTLVRANKEKLRTEVEKGVSSQFRRIASGRDPKHEKWKFDTCRIYDENRNYWQKTKYDDVAERILCLPPFSQMNNPPAKTTIVNYLRPHMKRLGDSLPRGKPRRKNKI